MTASLASVRDQVENRLIDASNLIFSTNALDEAIRAALGDLSSVHGSVLTLNGLDGASATIFEDLDLNTLVVGSVAYALRFRLVGKFEEASPIREHPEDLAKWATDFMSEFQALLTQVKLRLFQKSADHPHSQWEWEEGDSFS